MAAVESSATEVKTAAMADMVLDATSDADIIMSYLKKLQDQLSSTHKDAQRVAAFRAVLEIEHVPSAMLADATEEVSRTAFPSSWSSRSKACTLMEGMHTGPACSFALRGRKMSMQISKWTASETTRHSNHELRGTNYGNAANAALTEPDFTLKPRFSHGGVAGMHRRDHSCLCHSAAPFKLLCCI